MPKQDLKKEVACRIKLLRQAAKLTQEIAADKAGFHYKYYQKIESGTVNLTLDSIDRLAKVFGVVPKKLLP